MRIDLNEHTLSSIFYISLTACVLTLMSLVYSYNVKDLEFKRYVLDVYKDTVQKGIDHQGLDDILRRLGMKVVISEDK